MIYCLWQVVTCLALDDAPTSHLLNWINFYNEFAFNEHRNKYASVTFGYNRVHKLHILRFFLSAWQLISLSLKHTF